MAVLSWDISEINDTDYDGASLTFKRVRPMFDGVIDWIDASFATTLSDADCKTAVKSRMTTLWFTRDSEI